MAERLRVQAAREQMLKTASDFERMAQDAGAARNCTGSEAAKGVLERANTVRIRLSPIGLKPPKLNLLSLSRLAIACAMAVSSGREGENAGAGSIRNHPKGRPSYR